MKLRIPLCNPCVVQHPSQGITQTDVHVISSKREEKEEPLQRKATPGRAVEQFDLFRITLLRQGCQLIITGIDQHQQEYPIWGAVKKETTFSKLSSLWYGRAVRPAWLCNRLRDPAPFNHEAAQHGCETAWPWGPTAKPFSQSSQVCSILPAPLCSG